MEKVFIVGAGLMGGGIALVSAKAGYDVIVAERS
jgi:3-hydroxyacyl-CoA dehydrogenase